IGFYRDTLGMGLTARLSDQAAFLSAGGYHHHLGGNTWETRGAAPAPEGTARLLGFTIVLPDEAEVERVAERIGGTEVRDPSGNPLAIAVENAYPSPQKVTTPTTAVSANPGIARAGRCTPKAKRPTSRRMTTDVAATAIAIKVRPATSTQAGTGVARRRFKIPSSRS